MIRFLKALGKAILVLLCVLLIVFITLYVLEKIGLDSIFAVGLLATIMILTFTFYD